MKRFLALSLLAVLSAGAAFAHATLTKAVPADGATVASPATLTLTFSEPVSPDFSGATVTGPDGAAIATGSADFDAATGSEMRLPINAMLAPGSYTVNWHALSDDGHKVKGSYSFTVQ